MRERSQIEDMRAALRGDRERAEKRRAEAGLEDVVPAPTRPLETLPRAEPAERASTVAGREPPALEQEEPESVLGGLADAVERESTVSSPEDPVEGSEAVGPTAPARRGFRVRLAALLRGR